MILYFSSNIEYMSLYKFQTKTITVYISFGGVYKVKLSDHFLENLIFDNIPEILLV